MQRCLSGQKHKIKACSLTIHSLLLSQFRVTGGFSLSQLREAGHTLDRWPICCRANTETSIHNHIHTCLCVWTVAGRQYFERIHAIQRENMQTMVDSNPRPSHSEAPVLTASPLCSPSKHTDSLKVNVLSRMICWKHNWKRDKLELTFALSLTWETPHWWTTQEDACLQNQKKLFLGNMQPSLKLYKSKNSLNPINSNIDFLLNV